jgi:hypothetical protein
MDASLKKILRGISLELRHELEGWHDKKTGTWNPGDLERRLNEIGVWSERPSKPLDEMPHLSAEDKAARRLVDGYLQLRAEAGVERAAAVAEFVRESAYTWANRLFALRCMEARSIIEEVILQKAAYAGRSLVHQRHLRKNPDAAKGEDDGLFAVLFTEFAVRSQELPALFDPKSPAVALRPSVAALKRCVSLLSGTETVRGQGPATDEVFAAPDAFGWAYQYWNADEKDRVFEMLRTKKGAKIQGADIIPATQLYTEPYMVKFLVQNSLGALWMGMYPDSKLFEQWEYYVKDAERASVTRKPIREVTFLDPAEGSGHFHLEAFDLFYAMYAEEATREGRTLTPREIAAAILNHNLYGIDIDGRSVQIATAALWMKAKERVSDLEAGDLTSFREHLVATNIRLPKGKDHLELFLQKHPEDKDLTPALELVFHGLEHADELGALLQIEELLDAVLRRLKKEADKSKGAAVQPGLFEKTLVQGTLAVSVEDYDKWKRDALNRLQVHFEAEAQAADQVQAFFGEAAGKGLTFFKLLSRRYDVVAANPPYMGWRTMGPSLQQYLKTHFPKSLHDLCSAFLELSVRILNKGGISSFVLQKTVMFNSTLSDLRGFLLENTRVVCVGHLGTKAFSEVTGAKVDTVMICVQADTDQTSRGKSIFLRLLGDSPTEKAAALSRFAAGETLNRYDVDQALFRSIPGFPFAYRLSKSEQKLFLSGIPAGDVFKVNAGISTAKGERFVRYFWEAPIQGPARWSKCNEGGVAHRWLTDVPLRIDWLPNGTRIRCFPGSALRNVDKVGVEGLTFSRMSGKDLGVRKLPRDYVSLDTGRTIHLRSDANYSLDTVLVLLNSRYVRRILRVLNDSFGATSEDLERVRLPRLKTDEIQSLNQLACLLAFLSGVNNGLKLQSDNFNPRTQFTDQPIGIRGFAASIASAKMLLETIRVVASDETNRIIETNLAFDSADLAEIRADAWNLTSDVLHATVFVPSVKAEIERFEFPQSIYSEESIPDLSLAAKIATQWAVGGSKDDALVEELDVEQEDAEPTEAEVSTAEHPEGWLGQWAHAFGFGPLAIAKACRPPVLEGCGGDLLEAPILDRVTVIVLHLLGHRWPKQLETAEPLPAWADQDGVIPLTSGGGEMPMIDRVRERLAENFPAGNVTALEREFEEIVGAPLEQWLAGPFFKRHISQFKKRPIAWQLETVASHQAAVPGGKGKKKRAAVGNPVFACLVYYHKLDVDLLPKLRTQYVGLLRDGFETEYRTLERLANPTSDQQGRRLELEQWADELQAFDRLLEDVSLRGFGPDALRPALRQYGINDALLSLTASWLRRLSETIAKGPISDWTKAATKTELHPDLPKWLQDSMSHLNHFCAVLGPKPPNEQSLATDPTSKELAPLVCHQAKSMVESSLKLGCDRWWRPLDDAVLEPLWQEIKTAKAEIEKIDEELKAEGLPFQRRNELGERKHELKVKIKSIKADHDEKSDRARKVRSQIEKWACPEAEKWGAWLSAQPMFDAVTSLDGQRPPPQSIADFITQESRYAPDINDGVRVNIAPIQKAGLLHADVLDAKDADKAIADRAEWRADERRWVREGKLPQPGWWKESEARL